MKLKIFVAITAFVIFISVIYLEQTEKPYNNFDTITNNSITENNNAKIDTDNTAAENNITNPEKTDITPSRKTIKLPNFPITIIGDKSIKNIYDINADKIIIHFWASWCGVCKSEFQDIVEYSKINPNTAVIAISVDDQRDALGKYLDDLNMKYHIKTVKNLYFSWDHDKSISLDLFGTQILPENYIVNHNNDVYEVQEKTVGKTNWAELLKNNPA